MAINAYIRLNMSIAASRRPPEAFPHSWCYGTKDLGALEQNCI